MFQDVDGTISGSKSGKRALPKCENHVRRLQTFFTVVLEPNIHTFSVLSETLPFFFSCIAGRVQDMVGQLLEFWVGKKAN